MEGEIYDMFYGASWIIHKQARDLRKRETKAEKILWNFLSNKKLGLKFRRQHPINRFIADFYCHELKLVIEVDGEIHHQPDNLEYDRMRTEIFEEFGITVKRYTNKEVYLHSGKVISEIQYLVNKLKSDNL
jgi:very-short-patch-repair endonuclease